MGLNPQPRRHPEDPRFLQRGEGSRAGCQGAMIEMSTLHTRSFARLKNSVLRDDALDEVAQ